MMEFVSGFWQGLFWFLVLLTPLVFVHELGHYALARWAGVRVEVFSIGFGRELFGWTDRYNTRWKFSAIPLGGYIKMFGEHTLEPREDGSVRELTEAEKAVSLEHKSLPKRAAVVAAGPAANFLFAILVLAGMFMIIGQQFAPPRLGEITEDSAAYQAGLRPGDIIVSIDGEPVEHFAEITKAVALNAEQSLEFVIDRDGAQFALTVTPPSVEIEPVEGITQRQGELGLVPYLPAVVGEINSNSAAEAAGFLPGDLIISLDGEKVTNFEDLRRIVSAAPGRPITAVVTRDGQEYTLTVTPERKERKLEDGTIEEYGLLGVRSAPVAVTIRQGPVSALWQATVGVVDMTGDILAAVGQIIAGNRDSSELGGPIMIAQVSKGVAAMGLIQFLMFMTALSVNLGLINLFPIPVLDGGHLMFYAIEAVRGRPLGEKAQEYGFRIGLALVVSLMIFVTFNDLLHRVL